MLYVQREEGDLRRKHVIPLPAVSHKQLKQEKGDEEAEAVSPANNTEYACNIDNIHKNKKHSQAVLWARLASGNPNSFAKAPGWCSGVWTWYRSHSGCCGGEEDYVNKEQLHILKNTRNINSKQLREVTE